MLKTILLAISMSMSIGVYVPLWRRLLKRKHTRDFSKMSQLFICLCQVNGFLLATAEHAPFLMAWYVLQIILSFAQMYMIFKFWNTPEPRYRIRLIDNTPLTGNK